MKHGDVIAVLLEGKSLLCCTRKVIVIFCSGTVMFMMSWVAKWLTFTSVKVRIWETGVEDLYYPSIWTVSKN